MLAKRRAFDEDPEVVLDQALDSVEEITCHGVIERQTKRVCCASCMAMHDCGSSPCREVDAE